MKACLLALGLGLASLPAHAEIAQKFGALEIHYNAISTDELVPEVARAYKLERSKTRGLLTMSILKKNAVGGLTPLPAKISVYAANPANQISNITMREVRDGSAIYYLGEFRMSLPDTLKFVATVEVAGEPKHEISFDQKFYK